jgi:hypothetical protein
MSLHINRFIDRVRSAEHRGQRDFVMSMVDARDLQADLAKLLLALHVATQTQSTGTTDTVEIDGGQF